MVKKKKVSLEKEIKEINKFLLKTEKVFNKLNNDNLKMISNEMNKNFKNKSFSTTASFYLHREIMALLIFSSLRRLMLKKSNDKNINPKESYYLNLFTAKGLIDDELQNSGANTELFSRLNEGKVDKSKIDYVG
jgi:hypothetical protein